MNRRTALGILSLGHTLLPALARGERRPALFPLVGPYTNALRRRFNTVYRYLNVVDIGHGELAEVLITSRGNEQVTVSRLEQQTFSKVAAMFLDPRRAPNLAVHEETVAPESVKLAPRLNQAFDWAHLLHRQIYDILATDFPFARKRQWIAEAAQWYQSEPQWIFPPRLKTHDLMEHQWFSQYWRMKYPRFNGAIWAYHWLQLRLNEVMLQEGAARRAAGVTEAAAEFRAMFENPDLLPQHMPMAHTIAPRFLAEWPALANVFDNLHSFHDIYNDILAHPQLATPQAKREEVYRQLAAYLAPTSDLETAPLAPLPSTLTRVEHRALNRLTHLEHMAMMLLSQTEQMTFFHAVTAERAAVVERLRPRMAATWPNFEKKHGEMGHHQHH